MVRSIKSVLAVLVIFAATLAIPVPAAYAADGCGKGWHEQSERNFQNYTSKSYPGKRRLVANHAGHVRFCTKNISWSPDDHNRRVMLGTPLSGLYSVGKKEGRWRSFCVRQIIRVKITGVENGKNYSLSVSGSSKGEFSIGGSYSYSTKTQIVRLTRKRCDRSVSRINLGVSNLTVTGQTSGSEIQWVNQKTRTSGHYYSRNDWGDSQRHDEILGESEHRFS